MILVRLSAVPPSLGALLLSALVLAGSPAVPASAQAVEGAGAEPWLVPFSDDTAALAAAAAERSAGSDEPVHVLLLQAEVRFDREGRSVFRWRRVYRVVSEIGVEAWSTFGMVWRPWHQERPALRARVITASGQVHWLDPATVGESPVGEDSPDVLSDRLRLRAPLPALGVGAVVETEATVEDAAPLFDAGAVMSIRLGGWVSVDEARLVVEAPAEMPLRHELRLLPDLVPRREELGETIRWTFETGPLPAYDDPELFVPAGVDQVPGVALSTGSSWAGVASRYAEIFDSKLAGADLEAAVAEALGSGEPPSGTEKVERLLAWVQGKIRYTGLEFGEGAIVPRTPAETLERGYGDCKDKTALLVALLRQAGIPAHAALLRAGSRRDVSPALPGLGAFDHAIVYVPGPPEIWIDPTAEYSRAGELPMPDQGRWALVAAAETASLVRIPEDGPQANRIVEDRDVYLAPVGPARIVEVTRAWGASESALRGSYAQLGDEDLEEALESYAADNYSAESLGTWSVGAPRDLSRPFEVQLEALEASGGYTDLTQAATALATTEVLSDLPGLFSAQDDTEHGGSDAEAGDAGSGEAREDSNGRASGEADGEPEGRRHHLLLPSPHVHEIRYRIHAPTGFEASYLPESRQRDLGPATFAREVRAGEDGIVEVAFRFDTGKRLYSPDEVEAVKAGVRELLEEGNLWITFENVGESLLASGQLEEAIAELRRIEAEEPGEALHRTRIARALLAAGLGEAARREARAAVALDEELDLAYQTLGIVLQHDLLGRQLREGFDHEGALAAFRKARDLDPDNAANRTNLAAHLEHDPEGSRYGSGSRLEEAIAEYRQLREDLGSSQSDQNLLLALLRSGRTEEGLALLREDPAIPLRNAFLMTALGALEGSSSALRETVKIADAGERQTALATASGLLVQMREYPEAADLLRAAAKGSPNAAAILGQASTLRKARRFEDLELNDQDPEDLVRKLFVAALLGGEEEIRDLLSSRLLKSEEESPGMVEELAGAGTIDASVRTSGVPAEAVVDIVLGGLMLSSEGDPEVGYRVVLRSSFTPSEEEVMWWVPEGGGLRLLTSGEDLSLLGAEALGRAAAGDLDAARRWLDWAREEVSPGGGDDPVRRPVFPELWTEGQQAGGAEIRLAAAALAAQGSSDDEVIAVLRQAREGASPERAVLVDRALLAAVSWLERFEEMLAVLDRLDEAVPGSEQVFASRVRALHGLGRSAELEAIGRQRLERLPEDVAALHALELCADLEGDIAARIRVLRRILATGEAASNDYNNLAWFLLFEGDVLEEALELAQQAVGRSAQQSRAELHTLATVYAELGMLTEAREVLLQSMELGDGEIDSVDWYVLGRIAEHYGETEAARSAFAKVEEDDAEESSSTWRLAQRRLEGLAASAAPAAPARRGS